ncbi:RsmB/NOP family class I SAM-dependent RNA methyltransferase [Lacticaseibacillus zhaodongensis]|uniref:RsmB/NOP family class I SAM-dependent RNA methyltransferase n=1 Tax=Lacticaseibacillus zhaodongensis TaxID=2668065 RepID=UPI0012D36B98|nr:RsmF rRNA methyltransferase first C-terminal domain-containing protein [Lacticaseibacillus zhaodongensis]
MQLPEDFITKYRRLLGSEADAFLACFEQPAASGFRLNPLRNDPQNVALDLSEPINYSPYGYVGQVDGNSIDHVSGYVYSQEPSAQIVGALAGVQPGMTVLDLCAAPGGKSTALAGAMAGQGVLVSNEINLPRARILASNIERWGARNVVVTNNDPDSLAAAMPEAFDIVAVDAPCSGEGMFRKDADAVSYWDLDYPAKCAQRQREILDQAVKMVKPGGALVYSTCTFAPEEDEQIISYLLENTALTVEEVPLQAGMSHARPEWGNGDPSIAGAIRLWPQNQVGEGHFFAKLRMPGTPAAAPKRKNKRAKHGKQPAAHELNGDQLQLWQDWQADNLQLEIGGALTLGGDQLYALPAATPTLGKVRVLRPGLHLGTFKKRRFEPSHALATALPPAAFKTVVPVDEAGFAAYRHGETVAAPDAVGKRNVLLTYEDKGFAIGRLVNGTVKNLYPKGLRV